MASTEPTVLAHRIPAAAQAIGASRSKMYELIASGQIRAKKLGGCTIVEHSELERYLASLPDADIGGSADRLVVADAAS